MLAKFRLRKNKSVIAPLELNEMKITQSVVFSKKNERLFKGKRKACANLHRLESSIVITPSA